MPLNKLDNFIKNIEGRILYVNPSDLDSSDAIDNQGNSLARPFKTIQRALIEAARFSYVRGRDNDIVEKTTILLFPGEHIVDNRPGWALYNNGGAAYAVPRTGGVGVPAQSELSLGLDSIFDLNQEDNILYKFNSFYGGVVVPRGTSLIGLDLRKTKIRPKYVPNPTDPAVPTSTIFRITGACYFWQFSIFDGDETGTVYTNPTYFTEGYNSTPLFSHHKLRCFEYCDGVNNIGTYGLTDLDMYYSKLSNAYNTYREILDKYPSSTDGFAKRNTEWEIVGAFQSDPIQLSSIISGNGTTASSVITVTTETEHNLNSGTPIKIKGVSEQRYNISTKVQSVLSTTSFTYLLPDFPANLQANPSASNATVTVETDTVSGASPYIFNCSLRSVWGMNGMYANGSKASGFKSMVVAQFTGVSLQKDDRAFVKYDPITRTYNGVNYNVAYGAALPAEASQTTPSQVYHLDPDAIYRPGWETSHIKISDDAFIQVVSVFAIGFNKHFDAESGGDYSITNSNSNFGQISLNSSGFRKSAFAKDDKAYVTSIITPRSLSSNTEENIEWLSIDVNKTVSAGISTHLYLYGYSSEDSGLPAALAQGYRVGAKINDHLYLTISGTEYSAKINMQGTQTTSIKTYNITGNPSLNIFTTSTNHELQTGESVLLYSDNGDLPENIEAHRIYYVIRVSSTKFKLASSASNADLGEEITVYKGSQLKVISRVSDKNSGDIGSPIQWDSNESNWYLDVASSNTIYPAIVANSSTLGETTDLSYIKRIADDRSLDEKLYKLRVVIPKEANNSKNPEAGFVIQESSSTSVRNTADFTRTTIDSADFDYNRNPKFIVTASTLSNVVTVISEQPHNMKDGDTVIIRNVKSSSNTSGTDNLGYNGRFIVASTPDNLTFTYSTTDVLGIAHDTGTFQNDTYETRTIGEVPYFQRNDLQSNFYIYRNEIISEYIQGVQDGIYHIYALNASNAITNTFTSLKYSQSPVDIYPQFDRDNVDYNPAPARTFAKRSPLGEVVTNDRKKSVTRENTDKFNRTLRTGLEIQQEGTGSTETTVTFLEPHGFGGVITGTIGGSGGSGYTNGTYYNVKLYTNAGLTSWQGATAKVVVSGGAVTQTEIMSRGSGYSAGSLYYDTAVIGAGSGATFVTTTAGISTNIGDVVQFTGSGLSNYPDFYHRITAVPSNTTVSFARTTGDPIPVASQYYALPIGPSVKVSSTSYNSTTGTTTFTCNDGTNNKAHGLLVGNSFRVVDSSNNNLGDYTVSEKLDYYRFRAVTNKSLSVAGGYIFKHGMSANDAVSDITAENFGTRNITFYAGDVLRLETAVTTQTTLSIKCQSGIGTSKRFVLGDYIQIDNEIMRITSSNNDSTINVIRGSLGTRQESHAQYSMIRKIKPLAVEFRRPSIVRASGHTFEYLGYGPGNYSTSLPQVQVRTLSDAESFLSQAQERSGGSVVYTGMNNNGDVFNGNTKTSASSGETISFDIPTPTVTGQAVSGLSAVFDEVTIKEKLLVEGGDSGTVLSQFDGPVTFSKVVRAKSNLTLSATDSVLRINGTGTNLISKGSATLEGNLSVDGNTTIGGNLSLPSGSITATGNYNLTGIATVTGTFRTTGIITSGSSIYSQSNIINGGYDFILGNYDQTTAGNSGLSRALSKVSVLLPGVGVSPGLGINRYNDYFAGTTIYGNLSIITGNISASTSTLTVASVEANNVYNAGPIGGIVMWSGTTSNIPNGWLICNGNSLNTYTFKELHAVISNRYGGTAYNAGVTDQSGASTTFQLPDLVDKFIVGSASNSGTTVEGGPAKTSGGSADSVLVAHNHTLSGTGAHGHSGGTNDPGNHQHYMFTTTNVETQNPTGTYATGRWTYQSGGSSTDDQNYHIKADNTVAVANEFLTSAAGAHTHTVTVNNDGTQGSHGHTVDTKGLDASGTEANSQTGENANLPPYQALFYIIRYQNI